LQFEFGLAPAGTTFYLDDIQVFDITQPSSPNPLPPVNGDAGAPPGPTPPPPPPPGATLPALIPSISSDFTAPGPFPYPLAQFAGAAATLSFAGGNAAVRVTTRGAAQFHLQVRDD
jgi:hypothetical protein